MYSSTASTKQPLQAEKPYYDKGRGMPTTTRDLQAQPLQDKSTTKLQLSDQNALRRNRCLRKASCKGMAWTRQDLSRKCPGTCSIRG